MHLTFRTRTGSHRVDWSAYALLRDNVQHYLESGPASPAFAALHAVEQAVDGASKRVGALELRLELQRAFAALGGMHLADSAVSLRTRAILCGLGVPLVRGTVKAKQSGWELPLPGDERQLLSDHLSDFVGGILSLTDDVNASDELVVTCDN